MATLVEGNFYIPQGFTGDTHVIPPDSVIASTASLYDLLPEGTRGLDPACGAYTIPRVLRSLGASHVDASDIDFDCYEVASREAAVLEAKGLGVGKVILGDMLDLPFEDRPYDYIYTSLPFGWFINGTNIDTKYANVLKNLIKDEGQLIVDSADHAERDGRLIPVAACQIKYLEANGFKLKNRLDFETPASDSGNDTSFTELLFILASR